MYNLGQLYSNARSNNNLIGRARATIVTDTFCAARIDERILAILYAIPIIPRGSAMCWWRAVVVGTRTFGIREAKLCVACVRHGVGACTTFFFGVDIPWARATIVTNALGAARIDESILAILDTIPIVPLGSAIRGWSSIVVGTRAFRIGEPELGVTLVGVRICASSTFDLFGRCCIGTSP